MTDQHGGGQQCRKTFDVPTRLRFVGQLGKAADIAVERVIIAPVLARHRAQLIAALLPATP